MNPAVADSHGNTRLDFPIREATKDRQLGCRIPHIPSISIIHIICSICAIQHGITTRLYDSKYLLIRLRGARYYKHGSDDPAFKSYKQQAHAEA